MEYAIRTLLSRHRRYLKNHGIEHDSVRDSDDNAAQAVAVANVAKACHQDFIQELEAIIDGENERQDEADAK